MNHVGKTERLEATALGLNQRAILDWLQFHARSSGLRSYMSVDPIAKAFRTPEQLVRFPLITSEEFKECLAYFQANGLAEMRPGGQNAPYPMIRITEKGLGIDLKGGSKIQ